MRKISIFLFLVLGFSVQSQIGIGTLTPSTKSALDLTSTTRGFLLPRMSSSQWSLLAPNSLNDKGLQVFDSNAYSFIFWDGTRWLQDGNIYTQNGTISSGVSRTVNFTYGGSLNFDSNTLRLDATNNKVGIGTSTINEELVVNGTITNSAAYDAGASDVIDFSTSNLAYTSSTSTTITLNNIKNGGSYVLATTSLEASEMVTFTSTAFTFYYMGTGFRILGKQHLYYFTVLGTNVYVSMATEN